MFVRAEGGKGKPTIYYDEKGSAFMVSGPRNRRNNNPGNIEYGPFAQKNGRYRNRWEICYFSR